MTRAMDFHEELKLPAAAIAQIAQDTRNARTGQSGVPPQIDQSRPGWNFASNWSRQELC